MFQAGRHEKHGPFPAQTETPWASGPPLLFPTRVPGSLLPRPGPAGTSLGTAARLSHHVHGVPLLFEAILPTHSSLLES